MDDRHEEKEVSIVVNSNNNTNNKSTKQRIFEGKSLYEKGIITEEEYEKNRSSNRIKTYLKKERKSMISVSLSISVAINSFVLFIE